MKYYNNQGKYQNLYNNIIAYSNNIVFIEFNKLYNHLCLNGISALIKKEAHNCESCNDSDLFCVDCYGVGIVYENVIRKDVLTLLQNLKNDYPMVDDVINLIISNITKFDYIVNLFDKVIDMILIKDSLINTIIN